jgi:uncharacterized coiled-coil protein SlyX
MDSPGTHEHEEIREVRSNGHSAIWLATVVVALALVCIFAYGANHRQQQTISQLNAHESDMNATIGDLQNRLSDVTNKMNDVQAAQSAAAASAAQAAKANARNTARAATDPRWGKVQNQLDAEQQQLADEQNALNSARADLQGAISATGDQLNGAIAKTHDELIALEQRGERNYDEFDLAKGKSNRLYRIGPISLALRKADPKHKHYDLALMVNDNLIQKKNVDLFEPIWLRDSEDPQSLEIVVNKIDKDHIHGYVSSPKFTQGQLTPTSAPANAAAPQTQDDMNQGPAPANNPQSN